MALARLRIQVGVPVRPSAIRRVQADVPMRPRAASHPLVRARVPARATATRRPWVHAHVPARVTAARHPRVYAGVPARVTATSHPRVYSRAPARVSATCRPRVTAVRTVHTARFRRMTLVLHPGTLVCGPPASGTVPPVPAAVTAAVAIGPPAGVTGGSTVRIEVGVTGGDGSTPARVHGGLRTAVAHTPLTPPWPATVTIPKSLHHGAPRQAPLPVRRGRSHWFTFRRQPGPRAPATATDRPPRFPERESR